MPLGYVQAVQDIAIGIYKDRAFFVISYLRVFVTKTLMAKKIRYQEAW